MGGVFVAAPGGSAGFAVIGRQGLLIIIESRFYRFMIDRKPDILYNEHMLWGHLGEEMAR